MSATTIRGAEKNHSWETVVKVRPSVKPICEHCKV
ncbi:MAG: 50S ribosomal protein L36, partial [Acidimicrobiales bacterium]